MNVLSDLLCDTSSLLASQNYKSSSSDSEIISPQGMYSRSGSLNILDTSSQMPAMSSMNHQSSPSSIDLFNSTSQIHIAQNVDTEFEERSESIFSDPFAEIVPSWLTHDFMKVSDNLPSPSILSNVSDIYPSTQEDERLEMLDLGFTPDLTSHDLTAHDLNRNCIDETEKLFSDMPIQRYTNHEPLLLPSLSDINVSHLSMPSKSNLQYQKFKQQPDITNSSNLIHSVLNCENQLVHLPIHSDITSQCLTTTSSPTTMHSSQSHPNSVNTICDKLPQINLSLNSFLGNDISAMQLLRQDFPSVNLSNTALSHPSPHINNCEQNKILMSENTDALQNANVVLVPNTQDSSVQVSCGKSPESENCNFCKTIDISAPIEIVQCYKCSLCDFVSIHKCYVQNHMNTLHSKSGTVPDRTNSCSAANIADIPISTTSTSQSGYITSNCIANAVTTVPLSNQINATIFSSECTYTSDSQVVSKSNFASGHNLSSTPIQLSISESVPVNYQLIPISGVVIDSVSRNENSGLQINGKAKYLSDDLNNNLNTKQRPILKKPEELSEKKPTESKKVNLKLNDSTAEKSISAQKKGWRKKIRRELGSYICEFKGCNVRFKALDNLEYHRKCHVSGGNSFACPECGIPFNNWSSIAGHLWRNHSNDMELHACDVCSFRTFSLSRLENYHKKTHLDECLFLCDTCGKKFKNRKQLRNHRAIHNKKRPAVKHKSFKCNICLSDFTSKSLLHTHQDLAHNLKRKNFLCSYCDYTTHKKSTMDMHMRQHTGEKPFHCDKCEYKTSDHNSLRRHKMIHTGEKSYKCPYCSYSSIQANTYKDHLKRKHPGQEIIYSCKLCSFRSVKYETFNIHMEEHNSINKHKQLLQINEMSSNEEMLPLVEAMGIRLSNGDSLTYLNNSGNSQSFVNTVNLNMMNICQESSI